MKLFMLLLVLLLNCSCDFFNSGSESKKSRKNPVTPSSEVDDESEKPSIECSVGNEVIIKLNDLLFENLQDQTMDLGSEQLAFNLGMGISGFLEKKGISETDFTSKYFSKYLDIIKALESLIKQKNERKELDFQVFKELFPECLGQEVPGSNLRPRQSQNRTAYLI